MTLEKAIDMLKAEYEEARTRGYIRNPLAWALYKVWRAADRLNKSKGGENDGQQQV